MFSIYANVTTPTQLITKAKVKIELDAGHVLVLTNLKKQLHDLTGTITEVGQRKWDLLLDDGTVINIDGNGPGCRSCGGTKVRELAP